MLHITDQYFVSHTSYNCTDIFQRGRIQGKYTDNPNLIYWTTSELVKIINEYVDFITKIEDKIMSLPRGHEYIRNLCEIILFHKEFIKTLGRPKERKNLDLKCIKYDRKNNAMVYSFPPNLKPEKYKEHFSNWCKEQEIEFNGFINRIEISEKNNFIKENGIFEIQQDLYNIEEPLTKQYINKCISESNTDFQKIKQPWLDKRIEWKEECGEYKEKVGNEYIKQNKNNIMSKFDNNYSLERSQKVGERRVNIVYLNNEDPKLCISYFCKQKQKNLPKSDLNILQKQNYKQVNDNKILYSKLNYKYINDNFLELEFENNSELDKEDEFELNKEDEFELNKEDIETINDESYFFITADGYVYHHDPGKSIKKVRIQIKSEIEKPKDSELIIPILTFKKDCIKEIEGSKRVCVKKVREAYNTWCKKNSVKAYKKLKDFRENFEKYTGLKRSKTNINGYKIELKI